MGMNPLYYTFLVFAIIMALIYYSKPKIIFDDKGRLKSFGIGKNKTLLPLPILAIIIAIFIYTVFYFSSTNNTSNNPNYIPQHMIMPMNTAQAPGNIPMTIQPPLNIMTSTHQPEMYRLVRTAPDGTLILN